MQTTIKTAQNETAATCLTWKETAATCLTWIDTGNANGEAQRPTVSLTLENIEEAVA